MKTLTLVLKSETGETLATWTMPERSFSSGKKGFGAYGKVALPDGTRLQVSANLVIPHSEVK